MTWKWYFFKSSLWSLLGYFILEAAVLTTIPSILIVLGKKKLNNGKESNQKYGAGVRSLSLRAAHGLLFLLEYWGLWDRPQAWLGWWERLHCYKFPRCCSQDENLRPPVLAPTPAPAREEEELVHLGSNPSIAFWAGDITHLCLYVPVHLIKVASHWPVSAASCANGERCVAIAGHGGHNHLEWQRRWGLSLRKTQMRECLWLVFLRDGKFPLGELGDQSTGWVGRHPSVELMKVLVT